MKASSGTMVSGGGKVIMRNRKLVMIPGPPPVV